MIIEWKYDRNRVEKDSATLREIDWNTRHGGLALLKLFHRACLPQAGVLGLFLAYFPVFSLNVIGIETIISPSLRLGLFQPYFHSISVVFQHSYFLAYLVHCTSPTYLHTAGFSKYTESTRSFTIRFQLCISLKFNLSP
jgi:hypothetical protein